MKIFGVRSLLILSVLLTVVSAVITYLNVQQKKESTSLVIHTYKVIQASTRLLSLLKDLESGHHGYLITGDSSFLTPYHEALADIDGDIDTLVRLVENNPAQLSVLREQLIPTVDRKRAHLEETFEVLKRFGRDSASHFAGMRIAKARMDSIRLITLGFIDSEQALLSERNASLEETYVINDVIRFSSFTLIGVTSLAALITIIGKDRDNRRLLAAMKKFNQQLEEKVKERTRELESANTNLVRLNEEKNHFLGITTHDLKTPLAGITGLLELMKTDKGALTPQHLEYVQLMAETCNNMEQLITDLLDLNRIEQGSISLNYQDLQVPAIFHGLEERFQPLAHRKHIKLNLIKQAAAASIRTDGDALNRILDNVVSNAIKFSPLGKTVSLTFRQEDSQFCFDVDDEGPGIRPEEHDKLFRRFQKLSAKPTGGESSSGLGLSIASELVGLLHGSIEATNRSGDGTRFTVRIPAR